MSASPNEILDKIDASFANAIGQLDSKITNLDNIRVAMQMKIDADYAELDRVKKEIQVQMAAREALMTDRKRHSDSREEGQVRAG